MLSRIFSRLCWECDNDDDCLRRGVNVGVKNQIKLDALRAICEDIGLRDARTYIQSGNVVFRTADVDEASRLAREIERVTCIRTSVITRAAAEMRTEVERNPFSGGGSEETRCFVSGAGAGGGSSGKRPAEGDRTRRSAWHWQGDAPSLSAGTGRFQAAEGAGNGEKGQGD